VTEAGRTTTLRQLPDLLDFLDALNGANAKYLVIGGHAVGLHGHSRATKDLDVSRLEKVRAKEHEAGRKRTPSKDRGRDDS
jgi:hypothetical protein